MVDCMKPSIMKDQIEQFGCGKSLGVQLKCVEEIPGWSSRPQENNQSFQRNRLKNIPPMNERKSGRCQHVTGWI